MDAEAGLPHTAPQSHIALRQGEALLELDVNAHDSSDADVSVHGAFPLCAERAEQSGNRLRRKGCDLGWKP